MAGLLMSPEFRDQVVDTIRTVRKTSRTHDPLKQGRLQQETRYQGYFQTTLLPLGEESTAPPTAEFEIWEINPDDLTMSGTGVTVTVTNRQCDLTLTTSDLCRIEMIDGEWRPYVWENHEACSSSGSESSEPSEPSNPPSESSEPSEPSDPSSSDPPSSDPPSSDPPSSDPPSSDPSGSDPSGSSGPSESSPGQSTLSQSGSGSLSASFSQGSRSSGSGSGGGLSTSVSSVSISGSSESGSFSLSSSSCSLCYCFLPVGTITNTFQTYENNAVSTSGLASHEAVDEGVDSSDDAATAVRPGTNSSNAGQIWRMALDGDATSDPSEAIPYSTITGVTARMRARVIQYGATTVTDQEIDVTIGDDGDAENAGSCTFTVSGTSYQTYEEEVTGGVSLPAAKSDIDWDEFVDRWVMNEDRKNETSFEISAVEICVQGS